MWEWNEKNESYSMCEIISGNGLTKCFQNQVTYPINPLYQMSQRLKKVRLCLHSLVRFGLELILLLITHWVLDGGAS